MNGALLALGLIVVFVSIIASTAVGVAVMIYGYGLTVQSWPVIVLGALAQLFLYGVMSLVGKAAKS